MVNWINKFKVFFFVKVSRYFFKTMVYAIFWISDLELAKAQQQGLNSVLNELPNQLKKPEDMNQLEELAKDPSQLQSIVKYMQVLTPPQSKLKPQRDARR